MIGYNPSIPLQAQLGNLGDTNVDADNEDKPLLKIINMNQTFYLESTTYNTTEQLAKLNQTQEEGRANLANYQAMYLVVRSLKHNNEKIDYEIQDRDILKVGRVKFAVKEIGNGDQKMEVDNADIEEKGHIANSVHTKVADEEFEEYEDVEALKSTEEMEKASNDVDDDIKCRFCWTNEATVENPLIKACLCQGSVAYIHFLCLRNWLEVKRQTKTSSNFSSYYWRTFECEICKKALPLQVKVRGTMYNLVQYEKPDGDFLVLESLNQEKNTSRIIHIIRPSLTKDCFKLGRGHESDLRINDISVSRCHAKIKFVNNKFLLEDNTSKFGTLVLVK